jgi:hypothetical protein
MIDFDSEPGSWAEAIRMRNEMGNDNVNHPAHYQGKIEAIDAITVAVEGLEGIEAVCTANALKYLWRWKRKNGIEDLRKAHWYIERLIGKIENDH